jgi:hypothetical protein
VPPLPSPTSLEYLPKDKKRAVGVEKTTSPAAFAVDVEAKKKAFLAEPASCPLELVQKSAYDDVQEREERKWAKVKLLSKYNPLVPLGALVTAGVLLNGVWSGMRKKDPVKSQRMMRYRVIAQGATVIALVIGMYASQLLAVDDVEDLAAPPASLASPSKPSWKRE